MTRITNDNIDSSISRLWNGLSCALAVTAMIFAGPAVLAVSNYGEIVGWAENFSIGAAPVAMLWIDGEAFDLNLLTEIPLSADANVRLEEANAVDDLGRVAGYGRRADGVVRAFLLTPRG